MFVEDLAATRSKPGFMFAVGNHIPANVTDEMCARYIDYLRTTWQYDAYKK